MLGAAHLGQVAGRSCADLVHPLDRDLYNRMHRRTSRGTPSTWEFLAARVSATCPGTPVLLMSGYDEIRSGTAADAAPLPMLRKPFVPATLAHAVRNVLDAVRRQPA